MKNKKFSRKDLFVLGSIYTGLITLALVLPEDNDIVSGIVLAASAVVSLVMVERIK